MYMNGIGMIWGTQCNHLGGGDWDVLGQREQCMGLSWRALSVRQWLEPRHTHSAAGIGQFASLQIDRAKRRNLLPQ
jgi:hypothetical protein